MQGSEHRRGWWILQPAAVLTVALVGFSSPAGVVANGVIAGLITSLVAVAIVLVHRSARVLNLAAAELGLPAAVFAVLAAEQSGVPWFVAAPVAVVGGALAGLVVDFVVLRRFFRSPRLIVTVLTLGVGQVLAFAALRIPSWWGVELAAQRVQGPVDATLELGAFTFNSAHGAVLVACPVVIGALAAVLRFSRVGVAMRAAAELPDRAATLGVPVRSLQSAVWTVAGALAGLALFLEAGVNGLPLAGRLGYTLLLSALAAAVLGRFANLTVVVAASIALGVLQQCISWNVVDNTTAPATGLAIVIALALLTQRIDADRVDESTVWRSAATVRAVPEQLRRVPEVRWAQTALVSAGAIAVLVLPMLLGVRDLLRVSSLMLFAMVGLSLVVLTGWGGQISLGQVAFMALGAAIAGKATLELNADLLVGTLLAGGAGAAAAVVMGIPALRLRGTQLAVITLAFAVAATTWILDPRLSDWVPDDRIERLPLLGRIDYTSPEGIYWVSAVALGVSLLVVHHLRWSRFGRTLIAARDNPDALAVYGVSVLRVKLTAFAVSGFLAAAAGGLYVHHQQNFDIGSFDTDKGIALFVAVVVGGSGAALGGLIGVLYWLGAQWWLDGPWQILATGLGVIGVLSFAPEGLAGVAHGWRDRGLRWVAARRRLDVPALQSTRQVDHAEQRRTEQEQLAAHLRDSGLLDQIRSPDR